MKGKFTFKKLVLTGAVILFILSLITSSVIYNNLRVQTTQDNAYAKSVVKTISINLKKKNGTPITKNVGITNPIMQTADGTFNLQGKQIVQQAAKYLGRKYDAAQEAYQPHNNMLDCSGLVRVSLRDLGVSTDGFYERGNDADLPRSVMSWISYDSSHYFHEVATYAVTDNSDTSNYCWNADYFQTTKYSSIYDKTGNGNTLKVNYNGQSKAINVLKINNPINNELRWYNYYDANGKLTDLPMGTIVCSYGGVPYKPSKGTDPRYIGPDHMWICIGNLGTASASDAATKLVKMGIITDKQTGYVRQESTTSKYWMIESSPKTGRDGVYICNYDPDLNTAANKKGVGSIWAYQIANGPSSGSFTAEVKKVDRDNPNTGLAGAKYNFQDRTTSPTSLYTDSTNVDKTKYTVKGGAITTGTNGTAQLPVGGSATSYTRTIDREKTYPFSIHEVTAPTGYYIDGANQHFGFNVHTKLENNTYVVSDVLIYHGNISRNNSRRWNTKNDT